MGKNSGISPCVSVGIRRKRATFAGGGVLAGELIRDLVSVMIGIGRELIHNMVGNCS
jgi:hypothetical protein